METDCGYYVYFYFPIKGLNRIKRRLNEMAFAAQPFLQSLAAASLVSLSHNGLSVQAQ